jgi:two-component system repressor protein LuxO
MAQAARFYGPAHHRVLVVDNDFAFARRAAAALAAGLINSEVEIASDLESAERRLSSEIFNAVLASEHVASDPVQLVDELRRRFTGPLLILTEGTVEGTHLSGADAVIAKPCAPVRLVETLSKHLGGAPASLEAGGDHGALIGASPAMRAVFEALSRIAPSEAPAFIRGARGTGKTTLARLIHERSSRADRAFVAVDCDALDDETLLPAFFGTSDQRRSRAGFLERASGGTLFLDNVEALPLAFRARLLAALRSEMTQRLGNDRSRRIDLRVIAAGMTVYDDDLERWLSVLPLELPALRERGGDTVLLARHFLRECADREGRSLLGFDLFAERLIAGHDWPGNLWDLKAMIQRLVVLNEGPLITADMLPSAVTQQLRPALKTEKKPPIRPLREQQDHLIEQARAAFGGNTAKAAAALQINPSTIYRRRPHLVAAE